MSSCLLMFLQEPSDNGPLFSELKFYMRAAKPDLSKLSYYILYK